MGKNPQNSDQKVHPALFLIVGLIIVAGAFFAFMRLKPADQTTPVKESRAVSESLPTKSSKTIVPRSFEKSPFVAAQYNIFDNLVFKDVTALGGKNAWVNIKEDIKFKVDKNLPAGTAVLGGKVGLYDCSETTCHLERARVLVSSEEEMQKWDNSLYKVRQNYLEKNKPGPIFKEPQKVNPPFAK